jgi:apolipoprotein N-acyltransferase
MVMVLLSALLASAAFAPIGIWWLAPIGYAVLFRRISKSKRQIFHFFIFGFIYNAIVLHWSGKFVGALPWLLLSLLQALFYIPVGFIAKRFNNLWLSIFTLLLMEEFRSIFPFGGFGWTRIAFSQVDSPALPIVAYGGVLALSGITLGIAALLTNIRFGNLFKLILIFIFLVLIPANPQGSGPLHLLAIQGNTPSVGLEFNSRAKAVFELHREATYKFAKGNYDAIVWPENAIDIDPANYPDVASDIESLTAKLQSPLIAGVVLQRNSHPANASVMFGIDGQVSSEYLKRGLTPFGEYMPLRNLAEFISPYAKNVVDFKAGELLQTHLVSGAQLGPIICYEIINDKLVRDAAKNSQALIVQTNSATFAGTAESRQQLAITRIRAVESSRNILSISTIGISALIDSNGRIVSETHENTQSALTVELPLNSNISRSDKLGSYAPIFTLGFAGILALRSKRKKSIK